MPGQDFLQVEERHLKHVIQHMSWSPNRDLIALATSVGELHLYRLSALEKVWSLQSPESGDLINQICWRPDGCVIAVAYNAVKSGISFIEIEKANVVWKLNEEKSYLQTNSLILKWFEFNSESQILLEEFASLSFKNYIPQLPTLPSKDWYQIDIKQVIGSSKFNLLLSCDDHCNVVTYAYGIFPMLTISCSSILKSIEASVSDIQLSPDFHSLSVIVTSASEKTETLCDLLVCDLGVVLQELDVCDEVAQKICHLLATLSYMENVLDSMNESCEAAVQEMETKMTKYLLNKSLPATIGDEFMHMLMWGKPSDVLEDLLLRSISEKGVNALGTLIEASYTSIQQLLAVNFQLAADKIYYHLTEIKGLCSPSVPDSVKLFEEALIDNALKSVGSLILKAVEMQKVIGDNLRSFKLFFHWLCYSVRLIRGEHAGKINKLSQLELEFVADFIMDSFIHEHEQLKKSGQEKHFNLNKVYQYLQDSPLVTPLSTDSNEWYRLLETTPSLAHNPLILHPKPKESLRQLFDEVKQAMGVIINHSRLSLTTENLIMHQRVMRLPSSFTPRVTQWRLDESGNDDDLYSLISLSEMPCTEMLLLRTSTSKRISTAVRLNFTMSLSPLSDSSHSNSEETPELYRVCDVSGYNERLLTVVLVSGASRKRSELAQVSLALLTKEISEHGKPLDGSNGQMTSLCLRDASKCVEHNCTIRSLEAVKVASSGTRKVACVLGSDNRHIIAYEMDQLNDSDDPDVSMGNED